MFVPLKAKEVRRYTIFSGSAVLVLVVAVGLGLLTIPVQPPPCRYRMIYNVVINMILYLLFVSKA